MRDPYIEKDPSLWGGKLEWTVSGIVGVVFLTLVLTVCDGGDSPSPSHYVGEFPSAIECVGAIALSSGSQVYQFKHDDEDFVSGTLYGGGEFFCSLKKTGTRGPVWSARYESPYR